MVESLGSTVTVLILDTRGADRDRNDRRILRSGLTAVGRADSVSYSHRGSRDEMLLSLPMQSVGRSEPVGISLRSARD